MRPYFSLDIETTGLNIEKSVPVQIGIVYDDGKTPIDKLPTLNIIIKRDYFDYIEPKALVMNVGYFEKMCSKNGTSNDVLSPVEAYTKMLKFFETCKGGTNFVSIAGKNVGNYDMPIIFNDMKKYVTPDIFAIFAKTIKHRYLDVGSMYATIFGYNPSLDEINKRLNYEAVSHDALADAKNVVYAIRCAEYSVRWEE